MAPTFAERRLELHEHVGCAIRARRLELGVGLKSLARAAGVSPSHLSRVENGKARPSAELLERVAERLGMDTEGTLAMAGFLPEDLKHAFCHMPRATLDLVREALANDAAGEA